MALDYNDGSRLIIKTRDQRTCLFYADWLNTNTYINTSSVSRQDADSCRRALNQLINQNIPNKEQQEKLLAEMEVARNENILPPESFDWLRQDERAAFWLWAFLCKARDYEFGIDPPPMAGFVENWYQRLNLSLSPVSHQERINIIITLFDSIIISTPPVTYLKAEVMEKLKSRWKIIYSKPLPLKWLSDEEDAVLWAWNNLQKVQKDKSGYSRSFYINRRTPGLTTWFTPLNHAERHLALRAALDLWDDAPDTKRLFLINLNKAWNQQKLRQSRTDKKALNTYLKNETKMRLDLMAERSGLRISDMLETLINDHYRKTCGGE
ncbi:hypothetical protein I5Q11_24260 [Serratia ureilytica]|uniref:hypothetical protein n=1 Tax=Serratia ureilytica TaxID=300181 RepID=UPI0018D95959|nr:hypothetical protein [Serratia ureilytica]MBH2928758.1 hypothetical protein [Serratia ureilytica]